MSIWKRIFAFVLCVALLLPFMNVPASANYCLAEVLVVNDFGKATDIRWEYYDAMRKGKISAVKEKGVWYYKFVGDHATVKVRVSAFAGDVENDYTEVNANLTEGIMASGVPNVRNFTYKEQVSVTSKKVTTNSGRTVKRDTVTTYTTYFSYLSMTGSRVGTEMELTCKKNGHVQFEYSNKVNGKTWFKNGYITPSTAAQYVAALKRTTSNSISHDLTPVFRVEITVPGTNCVTLNSAEYKGRGNLGKSVNVLDLIDVATTTGKVTASMSTGKLPFDDLVSLASGIGKILMVQDSEDYTSDDIVYLSGKFNGKRRYCLKSEFTSPVGLKKGDDYFRVEVQLNKEPSTTKTKTQIEVYFSME